MLNNRSKEIATMEPIRRHATVTEEGQVTIKDLPLTIGQTVEVVVFPTEISDPQPAALTARRLLESGVVGLWKDRTDIGDTAAFARRLRDAAQNRRERSRAVG